MSATARAAAARPSAARRRPAPSRAAVRRRPALTAVPSAPATVAGRGVFALVVLAMLVTGMGVLLVLNTSLAQGAFELGALSTTRNALAIQEQQLLQQVALEESPDALQARATTLGMVPVSAPVFLRLADGAVLGTPSAAVGAPRPHTTASVPVTGGAPAAGVAAAPAGAATTSAPAAGTTTIATTTSTTVAAPVPAKTTAATSSAAKPVGAKPVGAKPAAPRPGSDAAVADPVRQSDAAVADTTPAVRR
ncbi:MAG TPA: hypothetical protein VIJ41_01935 [Candidatus Nanopelagicales bacterium]